MRRFVFGLVTTALVFVACDGDADGPKSTPSVGPGDPSTSAAGSSTPDAQATEMARKTINVGEAIPFPDDTALIIETGCWQCDGPGALGRVYRDPSGAIRFDRLSDTVLGSAAAPDGSEIVAARCTRGECHTLGPPPLDAQTTIMRSTDGGITWQDIATLDGLYNVIALEADGGIVLAGPFSPTAGADEQRYLLLPSSTQPVPPPGATSNRLFPIDLVTLAWWSDDARRLLGPDGSMLMDVGEDYVLEYGFPKMSAEGLILVTTIPAANASPPGTSKARGFTLGNERGVEQYPFGTEYIFPGVWIDEVRLFGNATVYLESQSEVVLNGLFPSIIDLGTRIASPITEGFLEPPLLGGRNFVVAVQQGPFARVNTPDDCLNLRETAGDGRVVDCAANGVLLRDREEDQIVDGVTWLRVSTPGNPDATAWVSAQFVER